jgi:ATP-dependent exoDNAse (exonuclease V) beta subunit
MLKPILSKRNEHSRDKNLHFDEPTHKYTILTDKESNYTSVTTWNHQHFPHFNADLVIKKMMNGKNWNSENKYWGKTAEEIKKEWSNNGSLVSGLGTTLHFNIECFMNEEIEYEDGTICHYTHEELLQVYEPIQESCIEWEYFLQFVKDFPHLKPYRTEWMIYDEDLKLAGSIDMVYENDDGSLCIYDWKRSKEISKYNNFKEYAKTECIKHLPNTNFWHYSLQLNTYKKMIERKYGKKVTDLYLVRLHPNNENKSYDLIKCADLSREIDLLFSLREKTIS